MAENLWTTDPREALRAHPGFTLASMDRRATPGWGGDKAQGKAFMDSRASLLSELQERLFAEGRVGGKRSVLVVVQGLDTAGKGGMVRHVMGYVDPQGVSLASFGVPTEEERQHHYLWRIENKLPTPGRIGVFDRSHYEDVLVVRVDELIEESVWSERYDEINEWEKQLVESGTTILKFALMVSHEEQGIRLMERLDRPDKRWKYSTGDLDTRAKWHAFQEAYQAVFDRTSTEHAPWYVLPADRKWFSRLALTEILTRTLVEMEIGWPSVRWSPEVQRRNLAKSMSTASLVESYEDTPAVVTEAMEETLEVRRDSADLLDADPDASEQRIAARRAEWLTDLEETLAHKRELLAARDDAPALTADIPGIGSKTKKAAKSKKSKKGKKKSKK